MNALPDNGAACTVCGSRSLVGILELENVPVFCNVQWSTKDEAINASMGAISLAYCRDCSHIFNSSFESEKLEYSEAYENSLHFSPVFHSHAEGLVARLIDKFDIRGKTVVEIGCGKGEFISMLCDAGNNTGYGFDASYEPVRESRATSNAVTFIQDFYSDNYSHVEADFVCCRHVLEHIQHPVPFLQDVLKAAGQNSSCVVYFEVPNALYSIEDMGIWDLIYEHCSYFTPESSVAAFHRAGLAGPDTYVDFGNQFLCIEATTGTNGTSPRHDPSGMDKRETLVQQFSQAYRDKLASWNEFLDRAQSSGENVVVWGAGSKGVTFLNCVERPDRVSRVVDVNPNKSGKFVAGTGHEIIGIDQLQAIAPSQVIVMNSVYKSEIESMLSERDINATISCA